MRGRDSLKDVALWRWADEGERWLRNQFAGKNIDFHTMANIEDRTITLEVYRTSHRNRDIGEGRSPEKIFEVIEPAVSFVSHTTLTKIILIAG